MGVSGVWVCVCGCECGCVSVYNVILSLRTYIEESFTEGVLTDDRVGRN